MLPMASGQSTGERRFNSHPRPRMSPTKSASKIPTASAVTDIQMMRACLSVGGGKAIARSALTEFARFFGCRAHGADQRGANSPLFQFMKAINGRPAGARDHVLEGASVKATFEHHFCAAQKRLRREPGRNIARKTGCHTSVTQGFNQQKHIRWSASA